MTPSNPTLAAPSRKVKNNGVSVLSRLKQKIAAQVPHMTPPESKVMTTPISPPAPVPQTVGQKLKQLQTDLASVTAERDGLLAGRTKGTAPTLPPAAQLPPQKVIRAASTIAAAEVFPVAGAAEVEPTPLKALQQMYAEESDPSEKSRIYAVIRDMRRAPDQAAFAERFIQLESLATAFSSERDPSKKAQLAADIRALRQLNAAK